ncbi:MAG: cytochrome c biogenesis protein CcsA [Candidatus Cyclobacteriaceae bacterium M3_2C_046]
MKYLHEHTWLSHYGHLLLISAFIFSLMAALSYAMGIKKSNQAVQQSWRMTGKIFFLSTGVCTFAAIALLYFIMFNRYFEFHYVWKYTNQAMSPVYLLASFWSGQEGSLLLWSGWILLFSFIFIQKFKKWEKFVLPVNSLVLVAIFSMLLGLYIGDVKIGNSPFILIRQLPENITAAWTQMPDYLNKVIALQDGNGLNPLLQNYWMVIHPPVLFAGFALTLFPFALALGGIFKNDLYSWIKPAQTWTVAGVMVLGAGILMGGAWAYEALSFGGFWAWDPVENASLVPWLILLAALHQLVISRKKKKGYFMAVLLSVAAFLMVIYASFLTRSGILGDSSVHSFTENGLLWHLWLFLMIFSMLAAGLMLRKTRLQWYYVAGNIMIILLFGLGQPFNLLLIGWLIMNGGFLLWAYHHYYPRSDQDDSFSSREFWMMTGIFILLLSAGQVILSTSIPVINRLFDTQFDAFTNLDQRNLYYGQWQVPFAIVFTALMAFTPILKFGQTSTWRIRINRLRIPLLLAGILTLIIFWLLSYQWEDWKYMLLLFTTLLALAANGQWMWRVFSKNKLAAGSALAHFGFALLLAGALISSTGKKPISQDMHYNLQVLDESFLNNENVLIKKGDTVKMDKYFITYQGKHREGVNIHYNINYFKAEWNHQLRRWQPGDALFNLSPYIQQNEKFGNVSEPDTRHYLGHDIFTHVKWADTELNDHGHPDDDFMNMVVEKVKRGKTFQHENLRIEFKDIYLLNDPDQKAKMGLNQSDIVVKTIFQVQDLNDSSRHDLLQPLFLVKDSLEISSLPDYSEILQVEFDLAELDKEPETVHLLLREKEYLVMQAIMFPGMNLLWTGCIIMVLGCGLVFYQRWQEKQKVKSSGEKVIKAFSVEEKVV